MPPIYPERARKAGISGTVILEITVGATGLVADTRVLRSIPMLEAEALNAVWQWRYEPAHLNGKPVPVIMTVTVVFP